MSNHSPGIAAEAQSLIERLKATPKGTKLTLICNNIFGSPFDYKCTLTGVRQHGFYTPGGGWGKYKSEGDVECYELIVKPYRCRDTVTLKIGQKVIDFRLGWEGERND